MATLNTLRTRGALFLSIVIGVALIAFLLGDLTSASSVFQRSRNRVGSIDGKSVDYFEFAATNENLNQVIQTMYGRSAVTAEQADQIREMAWQSYIRRYVYEPGFRRMGLSVGEAEQIDMVQGQFVSPVITSLFSSPQTGQIDNAALAQFVSSLEMDDTGRMPAMWEYAKSEMVNERAMSKYLALVQGGLFANDLEVARGVDAANHTYSGSWARIPFNSIADSLVTVSSAEVRKYFAEHRDQFRQTASRDVEYVVFALDPSDADYSEAADHIQTVAGEFAAAADPMQYASLNSQERTDEGFYSESQLSPELAAIAFGDRRGQMAGPTLNGNVYTVSRVAAERMMPDSVGARHILLPATSTRVADSLVRAIRGGASLVDLAIVYSLDDVAEIGVFPPQMMVEPFATAISEARAGDVFTVETQFGLHVVQSTYRSPLTRKAQIATVTYNVEPSSATEQAAYNLARDFATAATGSREKFDAAVSSTGANRRVATIGESDRDVAGMTNSRELVRWSFNTKPGTVSPIMEIDGDYVVAVLTGAKEAGEADVRDVSVGIASRIRNEKKTEQLTAQLSGKSVAEVAAMESAVTGELTDLAGNAFYEPSLGVEPAVIGALESIPAGTTSKPIKGFAGVYVVGVSSVGTVADAISADSERVRLEATAETSLSQRLTAAMNGQAKIEDNRAKFF